MKRLIVFIATLAVAVGISASAATADGCACGGNYPNHVIVSGPGYCFIQSDWGPGASPRYTQRPCF